jgi:hypothetical protein
MVQKKGFMNWKSSDANKLKAVLAPFLNNGSQFQLETESDVYRGEIADITVCPNTSRVGVSMLWMVKLQIMYVGQFDQRYFVGHEVLTRHLEFTFDNFYKQPRKGGRVKVKPMKGTDISIDETGLTSLGETARFLPPDNRARLVRDPNGRLVSFCTVSQYLEEFPMPKSFLR